MQKDLKIGMILGLVLALALGILLSARKDLSIESRIESANKGSVDEKKNDQPSRFEMPLDIPQNPPPSDQISQNQEPSENYSTGRIYTVEKGDTLSSIALRFYGSTDRIDDIRKANRGVIKKPDMIMPGMKLIIPE